jgi:hypothetical protein
MRSRRKEKLSKLDGKLKRLEAYEMARPTS